MAEDEGETSSDSGLGWLWLLFSEISNSLTVLEDESAASVTEAEAPFSTDSGNSCVFPLRLSAEVPMAEILAR